MARAENKQLGATIEEFKSELRAANIKNKELEEIKTEATAKIEKLEGENEKLKSSLNSKNVKIKELQIKCDTSESTLSAAETTSKELKIKCETLESSLIKSKAKSKELEIKCKELDVKCAALESFLNTANTKNKVLEIQLDESKKEVVKATLEKRKIIITTLKKIQNKLLTNPLYAIIDRLKDNIEALDEAAKNSSQILPRTGDDIEVVDIASSEDDNASTLSYVSELRSMEEDFYESSYFDFRMSPDNDDKRSINVVRQDESAQPAVKNLNMSENNEQNSELVLRPRNCDRNIQNELNDDGSCDSDISLSVFTDDVTSTTGEEVDSHSLENSQSLISQEHSYSDRFPVSPEKPLPEPTSSECTSTLVDNQTGDKNEHKIEKHISRDNSTNSLKSQDWKALNRNDEPLLTVNDKLPEMRPIPIPEPELSNFSEVLYSKNIPLSTYQNGNISECDNKCLLSNNHIDGIVANLIQKYGKNLKLLNPVVLLTPLEYER